MDQANDAPNISLEAPKSIAIVRAGAIGDTIVLFPLLAALRRRFPKAQISAAGRSEVWEVAQSAGLCDRVFSSESIGWWTFGALGVELDPRLRAALGGAGLFINADGAVSASRTKELLISRVINIPALPPEDYTKAAAMFYLEGAGPNFNDEPAFVSMQNNHAETNRMLLIAPGAGSPRKRAPIRVFVDIANAARARNLQIALVAGEADCDAEREYYQNGGAADRVLRNVNLPILAREMHQCAGFVANDSGMAHLAAFAGLRGWVLFMRENTIVTNANVWAPPSPGVRYSYASELVNPDELFDFIFAR